MPQTLRDELSDRHLRLALDIERGRRFSNDSRHLEHYALYPAELAANPLGWPLENWRPFADRRLHELLLAVPPEVKYAPHPETDQEYARSKRLLREAMRGILPGERPHAHGADPLRFGLRAGHRTTAGTCTSGPSARTRARRWRRGATSSRRATSERVCRPSATAPSPATSMYVMRVVGLEFLAAHLPPAPGGPGDLPQPVAGPDLITTFAWRRPDRRQETRSDHERR